VIVARPQGEMGDLVLRFQIAELEPRSGFGVDYSRRPTP
jgi:hypothetical protein